MQTLLMGDLTAAARAILAVPPMMQPGAVKNMLMQAHAAHLYLKRYARPHPLWGNGSLMARANTEPQKPEPFAANIDYLSALALVIGITLDHKRRAALDGNLSGGYKSDTIRYGVPPSLCRFEIRTAESGFRQQPLP